MYLRTWTETLAPVIRQAGGTPALLMVWPEATRIDAFDAVYRSYQGAAEAVSGLCTANRQELATVAFAGDLLDRALAAQDTQEAG